VATLNYDIAISRPLNEVEKNKGYLDNKPSFMKLLVTLVFGSVIRKVIKSFEYQYYMSSWLVADMQKNKEAIQGVDWTKMIAILNKAIITNSEILNKVEATISAEVHKDNQLAIIQKQLEETISNFYFCIRLFKKATIKTVHKQPSELALSAVNRSANTINSIYAN
jgi:hypothetical protein